MDYFTREKVVNFLSTFVFLLVLSISIFLLQKIGFKIEAVTILDLVIITLATFRVIRMLMYEKVFGLIRYLINSRGKKLFFNSLGNLVKCPWCTGVWAALFVFDLHYLIPYGLYLNYLLAIAGVASVLVVAVNNLNYKSEILERDRSRE
jgi:hypothetical protein